MKSTSLGSVTRVIGRIPILDVEPAVDCGRRPARAANGEAFGVSATVFREGHGLINAGVVMRGPRGGTGGRAAPPKGGPGGWVPPERKAGGLGGSSPLIYMSELAPGTDRWGAQGTVTSEGLCRFPVEAWADPTASWHHDAAIKCAAGRGGGRGRAGGTLRAGAKRRDAIAAMGCDVVYLPPVHPIGTSFRKSRNNTLTPVEGDPGSPWAIGSTDGGHDALHRDLGTFQDFDALVARARQLGMEGSLAPALN